MKLGLAHELPSYTICFIDTWESKMGGKDIREVFITLSNPKAILFYGGFLPTLLELRDLTLVDIAIVAVVVGVVLAAVMVIYPYFADRARGLFPSRRSTRNLNPGAGTV